MLSLMFYDLVPCTCAALSVDICISDAYIYIYTVDYVIYNYYIMLYQKKQQNNYVGVLMYRRRPSCHCGNRPNHGPKKCFKRILQKSKNGGLTVYTLWLFNIAMENGPFIDGLPIKNDDFPWLC